ncbi:MAG: hypothetical protein IJW99_00770 [Clostridia bacterium]|nr:hypothetical protein [Clostridia bacterium]
MQNTLHPLSAGRLAARNDPQTVRARLLLRFSLWYFLLFTAGLLLSRYTALGDTPYVDAAVADMFRSPFGDEGLLRDHIRAVLFSARRECLLLLCIAASGMTYLATALSDAALGAHALSFGLTAHRLIVSILGHTDVEHGNLLFFLYFFSALAQGVLLLSAATEAVVFSFEYRDAGRALRIQREHIAARYLLLLCSHAGILLILRAVHTLLLAALLP